MTATIHELPVITRTATPHPDPLISLAAVFSRWLTPGQMRDLGTIRPVFGEMAAALAQMTDAGIAAVLQASLP